MGFFLIIKNKEIEKIQLEHDNVFHKPTLKTKAHMTLMKGKEEKRQNYANMVSKMNVNFH